MWQYHLFGSITIFACNDKYRGMYGVTMLQEMKYSNYSGNREFLGIDAGFYSEFQSQLEISFPSAATQLSLMNACFARSLITF